MRGPHLYFESLGVYESSDQNNPKGFTQIDLIAVKLYHDPFMVIACESINVKDETVRHRSPVSYWPTH